MIIRFLQFHCRYSDATLRQVVLENLHEQLDKHLALEKNVRTLMIALNDEFFENRKAAVGLIGRLALRNPAPVTSSLRILVRQFLAELESSDT
jgi:FKBP12-rapamycin complex-associated protein